MGIIICEFLKKCAVIEKEKIRIEYRYNSSVLELEVAEKCNIYDR